MTLILAGTEGEALKMKVRFLAIAAFSALIIGAAPAGATNPQLLLSIDFPNRPVAQIEGGEFHFPPGQLALIHSHAAPVVGYVAKGTILYQVEGMPPQVLKTGDAFYEPAGPRIIHFDNASQTEEAVFLDFNLEQAGEPFILFPKPPTGKVDRRALPTIKTAGETMSKVNAYAEQMTAAKPYKPNPESSTLLYIAEGSVGLKIDGGEMMKLEQGSTFFVPKGKGAAFSAQDKARVIRFQLD